MGKQELSLKEIHTDTLNIYRKMIEICNEINVECFVTYGTLLGAVRHKGYIPWDDDFDVMMLRPDYDKFLEYCEEHEEELRPFRLMNYHNTERYTFAISRFCDMRYEMRMHDGNDVGMGMFIDIYPLDGLGKGISDQKRFKLLKKLKWLRMGIYYSNKENTVAASGNLMKKLGRNLFCQYAQVLGTKYFISQIEKIAGRYTVDESDYVACVTWTNMEPIRKEYVTNLIDLEFEETKVRAPQYYRELLELWYGDYMQLPPEESRVPHHEYSLYRKTY